MTSKDPIRRKEIASLGGKAFVKKHGPPKIPLEALQRGGRNSGHKQMGGRHPNHGLPEKLFDEKAESEGYILYRHGFPDRAIEKDGKIVLVEVKGQNCNLEKNQRKLHKLLKKLGIEVKIWKPGMSLEFK
jgi:hypothetical protein